MVQASEAVKQRLTERGMEDVHRENMTFRTGLPSCGGVIGAARRNSMDESMPHQHEEDGRADTPDQAALYCHQRLADGKACLRAALDYLKRGWSVLGICPPDHMGVGRKHGQNCTSPGKAPWGPWKHFQDRRPTEKEIRQKWRDNSTLNVGIA